MSSIPDPLDLQCVVMLAETLNFTEAARRLHMTQPGVTARVNRVEKNHGYKLFDRSKGIVRAITPEEFIFVEEAKQILEHLHRLITRSDAAHRAFSETLSISRSHHADLQLLSIVVEAQSLEDNHKKSSKRRTMSAEAKERMRQAQLKRWAATKKAAKPNLNATIAPLPTAKKKATKSAA